MAYYVDLVVSLWRDMDMVNALVLYIIFVACYVSPWLATPGFHACCCIQISHALSSIIQRLRFLR